MGEINHRTAWYMRIKNGPKARIQWMPFYTVVVENVGAGFLEPVDCLKRRTFGTSETTIASKYEQKEINEMQEFFWGRQAGLSDESTGSADMTLHRLDWDWPL